MGGLIAETDPYVWAAESNAWAANFTYTAPQDTQGPLPEQYQALTHELCWRQVALGGYRLAAALNGAFSLDAASRKRVTAHLRGALAAQRDPRAGLEEL